MRSMYIRCCIPYMWCYNWQRTKIQIQEPVINVSLSNCKFWLLPSYSNCLINPFLKVYSLTNSFRVSSLMKFDLRLIFCHRVLIAMFCLFLSLHMKGSKRVQGRILKAAPYAFIIKKLLAVSKLALNF